MSRDTILVDADTGERFSFDNLATQKWLNGHAPGAERAVRWLAELAVERFQQGKDEEAKLLRETAAKMQNILVPQLKREAQNHEKEYPFVLPKSET